MKYMAVYIDSLELCSVPTAVISGPNSASRLYPLVEAQWQTMEVMGQGPYMAVPKGYVRSFTMCFLESTGEEGRGD